MKTERELDQCLTFINCQLHPASAVGFPPSTIRQWRAVTISRQTGAGGHTVAEALAQDLNINGTLGSDPWAVFDRNLVEKVLEDHYLPSRLARFMPEDRVSEIEDALEEMCGLHPRSETLVDKMAETILRLAELGNVILIGRGANVVTNRLDYVFHVRLVGSLAKRIEYVQREQRIEKEAAREFICLEDRGRRRYLKKYFDREIDDPLLYHLVINTDLIGHKPAARMIAETLLSRRPDSTIESKPARALRAA
jgi:cytidylate kinase